jgi:hypothetical protein
MNAMQIIVISAEDAFATFMKNSDELTQSLIYINKRSGAQDRSANIKDLKGYLFICLYLLKA